MPNATFDVGKSIRFWDFIFVTAANEAQSFCFGQQLSERIKDRRIPQSCTAVSIPDIDGKRIGSGIATLNVISYIEKKYRDVDFFKKHRCLLINSGGENRRTPCYSVCSKLFMPYTERNSEDNPQELFDKIISESLKIVEYIPPGLLILTGDVLPDFKNVCCTSFPETAEPFAVTCLKDAAAGQNHGVYVADENGYACRFLHKCSIETLKLAGAVDADGKVQIDTGVVFFSKAVIDALSCLLKSDKIDFMDGRACLNLYGDFMYPFVRDAEYSVYENMIAEETESRMVAGYRRVIFDALSKFELRLVSIKDSNFIHLGTEKEIIARIFKSNDRSCHSCCIESTVADTSTVGENVYIEYSRIGKNTVIGDNCIISHVVLENIVIPDGTVMCSQKLSNGKYTAYCYNACSNEMLHSWDKPTLPVSDSQEGAVRAALHQHTNAVTYSGKRISCSDVLKLADFNETFLFRKKMRLYVQAEKMCRRVTRDMAYDEICSMFGNAGNDSFSEIFSAALSRPLSICIRILNWLVLADKDNAKKYEAALFGAICEETQKTNVPFTNLKIKKDFVCTSLPLRINWGGGWSDTPPYCYEHGGTVLNAAIKVNGIKPVNVFVKKLNEKEIVFLCADDKLRHAVNSVEEILDCSSHEDRFSLHKAALLAFGVINLRTCGTIAEITDNLGGGFCLSTAAYGIPRGSGLGTSSILLTACIKALSDFFGVIISDDDVYNMVLCAEQMMGTGGGWQDSVGGFVDGVKLISSASGTRQHLNIDSVTIPEGAKKELSERFCLVYTGKKRLARNILKKVVIKYLTGGHEISEAYEKNRKMAIAMRKALDEGRIDGFAKLLNEQWKYSVIIDESCMSETILDIFSACSDMIDGKMVCGAGGGGFVQIVLKKGLKKQDLCNRLSRCFPDTETHCIDMEWL